ncbi:MAG: hypothetical protein HY023_01305 [Chloroflexi bacterium]|nr:hypothetical protein [Chloroflexota bacterium]MBI3763825.1 hypothetical protein [Chloroflexota bacterium]
MRLLPGCGIGPRGAAGGNGAVRRAQLMGPRGTIFDDRRPNVGGAAGEEPGDRVAGGEH